MRIKGISWVGVNTGSYDQMARFFTEVLASIHRVNSDSWAGVLSG